MRKLLLMIASFSLIFAQYSLRIEMLGKEFAGLIEDDYTDLLINPARLANFEKGLSFSLTNYNPLFIPYKPIPLSLYSYFLLTGGNKISYGFLPSFISSYHPRSSMWKDTLKSEYYFSQEKSLISYSNLGMPLAASLPISDYKFGLMISPSLIREKKEKTGFGTYLRKEEEVSWREVSFDTAEWQRNGFTFPLTLGIIKETDEKEYALALRIRPLNLSDRGKDKSAGVYFNLQKEPGYLEENRDSWYYSDIELKKEKGYSIGLNLQGRWEGRWTKGLLFAFEYLRTNGDYSFEVIGKSEDEERIVEENEPEFYCLKKASDSFFYSYGLKNEELEFSFGLGGDYSADFFGIDFRSLLGIRPKLNLKKKKFDYAPFYLQSAEYERMDSEVFGYVENRVNEHLKNKEEFESQVSFSLFPALEISFGPIRLSASYVWELSRDLLKKSVWTSPYLFDSTHRTYTHGPRAGEEEVVVNRQEWNRKAIEEESYPWRELERVRYGITYHLRERGEIILMNLPFQERAWFLGISIRL